MRFFSLSIPPSARSSPDHDEPTTLGLFTRLHREDIDPAHDILPVTRNQIPPGLAVVRSVLLTVVARMLDALFVRRRSAHGLVDGVLGVQDRDEVSRNRVDPDRP